MTIFPDITVVANCPEVLTVDKMPPAPSMILVPLHVKLHIDNRGLTPVDLTVPNSCEVFNWKLYHADGTLIQSEPPAVCLQMLYHLHIGPGHTHEAALLASLNGAPLNDGATYILKGQYYHDIPLEVHFRVTVVS